MQIFNKQVKIGALFAYLLIIFNVLYGIIFIPYMLKILGQDEYGLYKTIASLVTSLMIIDMGIGGTVTRYIAQYRAKKDYDKIPTFLGMMLMQAVIINILIIIAECIIFSSLDTAYKNQLSSEQLEEAKDIFKILSLSLIIHIFENVINGAITGCNKYIFGNGIKILKFLVRIILLLIFLRIIKRSIVIVSIDIILNFILLFIEILYLRYNLKIKIKFNTWQKEIFVSSGKYTIWMFLTSIAVQVNNNLDNIIIGMVNGTSCVAIYSIGLMIFGMFENLSCSISGVMLPTVSYILQSNENNKKLEDMIIMIGRIQFILLGGALGCFICLGKLIIIYWLGKNYLDVYIITLILVIPALFVLSTNVCLSILRAMNLIAFRTIILFISTVINAIITYIIVKKWSYIGAAIGTALSISIGSVIIMSIYYYKKIKLNMIYIYKSIIGKIWLCVAIPCILCYFCALLININVKILLSLLIMYIVIYVSLLILYGCTENERGIIKRYLCIKLGY